MMKKYGKIIIVALVIVLVIIISVVIQSKSDNKKKELVSREEEISEDEDYYYDKYGNKYYKGDNTMGYEDVVYAYIKALALLDFSTAYTYTNSGSSVISGYEDMNSNYKGSESGYSIAYNFSSKIYKQVLTSLVVKEIVDTVIMPDKYIITLNVEHLDFNNNEFWLEDKKDIFKKLLIYSKEESTDSVSNKVNEYLSKYIKDFYDKDSAPKIVTEIELELSKNAYGSWLIVNDGDLYALCRYNDGSYPMNLIKDEFYKWYSEYLNNTSKRK